MFMSDWRWPRASVDDGVHGGELVRQYDDELRVVRILKDLDRDISGQHVLIVRGHHRFRLTLSWLLRNLASRIRLDRDRGAAAQARRGEGRRPVKYVGFDIPNEFVVGYAWTTPSGTATWPTSAGSSHRSTAGRERQPPSAFHICSCAMHGSPALWAPCTVRRWFAREFIAVVQEERETAPVER